MNDKISQRRLQRIIEIIQGYDCTGPLHLFLKDYFKKNPVMGSTDRRIAATSVYNYFRTGKALLNKSIEEKISISNFLCGTNTSPFVEYLLKNYSFFPQDEITFPLERKMELVRLKDPEFTPENIFPFKENISNQINFNDFVKSILIQPKVWVRIRSEYIEIVKAELMENNISFHEIDERPLTLSFEQNVQLQKLDSFEKGFFEVQDLSSQKTGDYFNANPGEEWWDCCAGSGGKSMILKDAIPEIQLLATDARGNILKNLERRFKKAGIKNYSTEVIDLEKEDISKDKLFDGIICDVPCSGSGTWARTPEEILCFKKEDIKNYQQKQKAIVLKASTHLKKNGKLIYITCSVFKEENEMIVEFIQMETKLKLKKMKLIDGTGISADSLYVAVFG